MGARITNPVALICAPIAEGISAGFFRAMPHGQRHVPGPGWEPVQRDSGCGDERRRISGRELQRFSEYYFFFIFFGMIFACGRWSNYLHMWGIQQKRLFLGGNTSGYAFMPNA